MGKRAFIIVLDSMGIGELPDAGKFGDEGSNTLGAIRNLPEFDCPNLASLGLFDIEGVGGGTGHHSATVARMREESMGKDTTTGHWEIAGLVSHEPMPTYPNGFPQEIIQEFERRTGRKVLCNKPYSGTDVIRDYGREAVESGALIVYTSADSVFQIAAHEGVIPVDELYRYCKIAREILVGKHGVGRVIARPFEGEWPYTRTPRRHDFSLLPPRDTMLDLLERAGKKVIPVGKIFDIFAGRGLTECNRTTCNREGMEIALQMLERDFDGLCFINLVDFDMVYGHRNDAHGYAKAMTEFDQKLGEFLLKMRKDDLLIITADHGCDPVTPSTDHSREYTPMLMYSKNRSAANLGTRDSFADISATILDYFGISGENTAGKTMLIPDDAKLVSIAVEARKKAYTPYSHFCVGAALLTKDGKVYTGCNIENAAYSPSICAERTAIFKAVSEGDRKFAKLAIVGGREGDLSDFCAPCGVCRQVIAEFCPPDFPILLGTPERFRAYRLDELLPYSFTEKDL